MLVASLEFLAADFEQRVQLPVSRLKHTRCALELLVELYLDEDIASPRKVSVWYCFWGSSSRQEYWISAAQGRGFRDSRSRAHAAHDRGVRRAPPGCGWVALGLMACWKSCGRTLPSTMNPILTAAPRSSAPSTTCDPFFRANLRMPGRRRGHSDARRPDFRSIRGADSPACLGLRGHRPVRRGARATVPSAWQIAATRRNWRDRRLRRNRPGQRTRAAVA